MGLHFVCANYEFVAFYRRLFRDDFPIPDKYQMHSMQISQIKIDTLSVVNTFSVQHPQFIEEDIFWSTYKCVVNITSLSPIIMITELKHKQFAVYLVNSCINTLYYHHVHRTALSLIALQSSAAKRHLSINDFTWNFCKNLTLGQHFIDTLTHQLIVHAVPETSNADIANWTLGVYPVESSLVNLREFLDHASLPPYYW